MKSGNTGIPRLKRAIRYSLDGLRKGWKAEEAIRIEVILNIILLPLSFFLARDFVEWVLLEVSAVQLLITELFNSAIEAVVDRIGEEYHELSGRAKDLGAAAVMLSAFITIAVWGGLLIIRLWG